MTRARAVAALGVLAVAAVAIALVLSDGSSDNSSAATPRTASGAATVARRDLVATDTESGTLGYADPQTVFNRLSGTITWLPAVGALIRTGQPLYRVDGAPVILLSGRTPAYRDLSPGISDGADITELNANLVALGYDSGHQIAVDDTWQPATTSAVERWQAAHRMSETGTIALGQVVFLPGPQRVATIDAQLGTTGGSAGGSGGGSAADASYVRGAEPPEFVDLTTPTTTPTTPTRPTTPAHMPHPVANSASEAALIAALRAETLALQRSLANTRVATARTASARTGSAGPTRSARTARTATARSASPSSAAAAAGQSGAGATASAQPVLETTSPKLIVTVDLDATKQSEARVSEPVGVELPNGRTVGGRITEVSPVAESSSSSASAGAGGAGASAGSAAPTATVPVTIALHGRHATTGLDQAAVSVDFQQQVVRHALSVPVTALLATAGGGYELQDAEVPHTLIPVTPGLFAAGYVQVSGAGLRPGMQVTNSQG